MKVAIVYDRVNKWGGAERVLLALNKMFPKAPLYTSVYDSEGASWANKFPKIHTSFLQKIPFAKKHHEYFALLMPLAFESFDFSEYDLVISVTSEAAKGVITKPGTKHICYCLTPTRYLWSHHEEYFSKYLKLVRLVVDYLRNWDIAAAHRPDVMVAISSEVKKRIKEYYGRKSVIIHPPLDDIFLKKRRKEKDSDYFLCVSRLVSYKKVDLVVKAFNKTKMKLVVIGKGRQFNYLKSIASENIRFIKRVSDEQLIKYYQKAKALIFPQIEDYGLVAAEAISQGTPVIAYKEGGVRDIVKDKINGIYFTQQSGDSIMKALKKFDTVKFKKAIMIDSAKNFSGKSFKKNILNTLENI